MIPSQSSDADFWGVYLSFLGIMTTTVTVRNFTGKTISVQVDPATKVSGLKDTIAQTTLCKWAKPVLTWKGHELRDHQSLSHYDIAGQDVLNICERQFFGLRSRAY